MLSVVTWKWKPKGHYRSRFGPETVNILKQMVRRHYKRPHKFICVTDDPKGLDPDINVIPLWNEWGDIQNPHGQSNPSCYRRLRMFAPDAAKLFGPRFVSLDLDCVILGELSSLWDRHEDIITWGDTNPGTHINGSMLLMTAGCRPKVWDNFDPRRSPSIAKAAGHFGSDQGWISYCLGRKEVRWTTQDGVYSYRIHLRNIPGAVPPHGARIVMFHGQTDPWELPASRLMWVRQNWRYDPDIIRGVEAINLVQKIALLTDGTCVPITHMFDYEGDETQDINEALSFVAGKGTEFMSGLIDHYRKVYAT